MRLKSFVYEKQNNYVYATHTYQKHPIYPTTLLLHHYPHSLSPYQSIQTLRDIKKKIIILMSHLQTKDLQAQISWMRQGANYSKMTITDLQEDNKKVLAALRVLEGRLDRQLQAQKHSRVGGGGQEQQQADQLKVAMQSIKNNEQCIRLLQKQLTRVKERREQLTSGLQSKLNAKKHDLQKRIGECKAELKKLKLQQNQINKRLSSNRENPSEPESLAQHARLQQQLRVFSIKYVKILQKHNRVAEQLALSLAAASGPELQIPQQLYDKELQQRQEAQFKEYQGIVKMCTILSKRNDSEANKYNRLYSQKLKQLEKTIINLGQVDRMIALKEGEILEGKKNLELIKFRAGTGERERGEEMLSISQAHLRRASYSTARLPLGNKMMREREMSQGVVLPKSHSKRQNQP